MLYYLVIQSDTCFMLDGRLRWHSRGRCGCCVLYLCEGIGALWATSELKDLFWVNGFGFLRHYNFDITQQIWGCERVGLVWTEHCDNMFMLNPDLTHLLITGPDLKVQMVD